MKINFSIQVKAIFLLVVFSMNTVVGFACSVGLDMGFNSRHHHEEKNEMATDHHQHNGKAHDHGVAADHHSHEKQEDNCCKDEVIKFVKVDKQIAPSFSLTAPLLLLECIHPSYYYFNVPASGVHTPENKLFVRCHHPPIPNIRVAIQSFQI